LPEVGDTYHWYNVWISKGKYECDCVRKARVCIHIATVMLYAW